MTTAAHTITTDAEIHSAFSAAYADEIELEPAMHAALARNDTAELHELARTVKSDFWRAEIRVRLMQDGRYTGA
jgi:hypothetical protein